MMPETPSSPTPQPLSCGALTFLAAAWGGISLLSFVLFAFQFQFRDPYTGLLFRNTDYAWLHLGGHLVSGLMFAATSLAIWQHVVVCKQLNPASAESVAAFVRSHGVVWLRVAVLVATLLGYSILRYAYVSYAADHLSRFSGALP